METAAEDRKFQKELNAGATSLALLGLLGRAKRAMYGYEVAKQLEAKAGGSLPMNQGALYPVLRSLEQQGLLSSHVEPSVAGPARKYYAITPAGRQALRRWLATWQNTTRFVNSVLEDDDERPTQRRGANVPARAKERTRS
jgi:PadR family transcriptional regulator, regulatory protein PadR